MTSPAAGPPAGRPSSGDMMASIGAMPMTELATRIGGASHLDLEVVANTSVTPGMRRVQLQADGLAALEYRPGQDFMLAIPAGERPVKRRYTIRRVDRTSGIADVDFVVHGHGPGSQWATVAAPGDRIEAIGPRGSVTLDPDADGHLFVGDESTLPAMFAMAEAIPAGGRGHVVLEIAGPEEQQAIVPQDGADVTVTWLHRHGAAAGDPELLLAALTHVALPPNDGRVYLAGEQRVVATVRNALLARGVESERISPKAYWSRRAANAAHGEPLPTDRG